MAKTGHMYTYDSSQNVAFPAGVSAKSFTEGGTSLSNKYLGKTAKAADADKLDGNDSTYYLNYNNLTNKPTIPAAANNGTITIKQTGISDQTFTVNQSGNTTITLVDTNTWRPLGTGASDACAGNDARLSNARTPTAHTHISTDITDSLALIQGNNIILTQTEGGLEISAAADGKVKTVNNQQPDSNGNVQLTAANVGALANNASVVYYTAQSLNNAQKTQARTNIGAGTITEIKVNGTSKGTSGSVNLTNMVTFASSQTATVAGINKTTYTYNQPTGDSDTGSSNGSAYFPEGIIMGGTAASAGLVTRGICGVTTPDATTGACTKENLYINYDGNNNYQSNRQLVIQAGSVGSHYGNNLYQYAAARGDAVKSYCDATYVKYSATQSLTDTQKAQARTNIGAGTSSFTGYTSSNKLHTDYINNVAGWTSNKGTVTSVRVQAGTGLSSSQNTAQTNTLNTTISIASGYKLPTTTEWADIPSISGAYSISAGNGIVLTAGDSSLEISVSSTSSVTSGSTALVTSGAVYSAIQSAITTALNTSV